MIWAGWVLAASQTAAPAAECSAARLSETAKAIFEFTRPGGVDINIEPYSLSEAEAMVKMYQEKADYARRRASARKELTLAIEACESPIEGTVGTIAISWGGILVGSPPRWDTYLETGDAP